MTPEGTKSEGSCRSHEDIISRLPSNVIACILGKMPIHEAVRTSVLSKEWRFYYLYNSQLVYDDQFWKAFAPFFDRDNSFSGPKKYSVFDEIVTKYLLLHHGGLEKFEVRIPTLLSAAIPDVNKWILYLSRRNIKELTLTYENVYADHPKLPPYFFSCRDLTFLKLKNFVLSPPLEFKGFLNLHQVILNNVHFANNCFESFLLSCPLLRRLVLSCCFGIHLIISGPNLKELYVKAGRFKSISLEKAPYLSEVSVYLWRVGKGNPVSDLVTFVGSLPKVKLLRLDGNIAQLLAETPVPPMLSTLPYFLNVVELKYINFMNLDQISVVVCLLRSAPNLQELYIEASTVKVNQEQVSDYLKLLDSDVSLSKLRLAKLTKISGFVPEFEFIRFLLFSSPSLVTLSILEHPQLEAKQVVNIARKLLQFRPPPTVSIDFSTDSQT